MYLKTFQSLYMCNPTQIYCNIYFGIGDTTNTENEMLKHELHLLIKILSLNTLDNGLSHLKHEVWFR